MNVVISQPMFFPWVGLFEQIRLADVYVHYGDVQFSKGSFVNRVQIKTAQGIKWLTVPLQNVSLGQIIDDVEINHGIDWRNQHLGQLKQAYSKAPFLKQMLSIVHEVYDQPLDTIGALSRRSIEVCCKYYGLDVGRKFIEVQEMGIDGKSSQRVFDIVSALGGTHYITGWGAKKYLDHQLFESAGISVDYMDYKKTPYPQLYGEFTPYVSILDLIANVGDAGGEYICSETLNWKKFIEQ